ANYTYQQALNVTDPASSSYNNQIPYTPRQTIALNAGVIYNRFSLFYNQISSAHHYYLNENKPDYYLPAYSVSDASFFYNGLLNKLPVGAGIEINNLFNTRYEVIRSYPMP